ncbi:phosphopantetheine adenylyltransferase [Rhodoferax sp. AJA081-3]|nr:phosphopantetheine adenylyltransferase [Rhodoferax sp. AJA081-3]
MHYLTMAMLMVVGIIHLLPMSGVLGTERLAALYGLPINEPNLAILMRHRAVLFGLLGLFLVYAAFRPGLQTLAFVAGFASVLSFLWLAWSQGGYNPQIQRVVIADVVALVCLVLGGLVHAYRQLRN